MTDANKQIDLLGAPYIKLGLSKSPPDLLEECSRTENLYKVVLLIIGEQTVLIY